MQTFDEMCQEIKVEAVAKRAKVRFLWSSFWLGWLIASVLIMCGQAIKAT